MKSGLIGRRAEEGGVLLAMLAATLVVGFSLLGYMTLVGNANRDTVRSESWNMAMAVAEAGLEETMAHLQRNYPTNLISQGWKLEGTNITRTRAVGDTYYTVRASLAVRPVVTAYGFVRVPGQDTYVSRGIQIQTLQTGVVTKAFATKLTVKLNGNNIASDSYDSTDPTMSDVDGSYDPTKTGDRGDISTNLGLNWSFDAGNADIQGSVATGPDGVVQLGPNAVIGSAEWHDGGNTGAELGSIRDDSNVIMPPVMTPDMSGAFSPGGGTINGTNYSAILGDGKYEMTTLSGKMLVTGHATLLVTRQLNITGQDFIEIAPGASLQLYVSARTAIIGGLGVVNDSSQPASFTYFGLPSNDSLSISGGAEFSGVIYAPDTDLTLNGGGHVYGAIVSETGTMNGDYSFHFDESLSRSLDLKRMMITGWDEVAPYTAPSISVVVTDPIDVLETTINEIVPLAQ